MTAMTTWTSASLRGGLGAVQPIEYFCRDIRSGWRPDNRCILIEHKLNRFLLRDIGENHAKFLTHLALHCTLELLQLGLRLLGGSLQLLALPFFLCLERGPF